MLILVPTTETFFHSLIYICKWITEMNDISCVSRTYTLFLKRSCRYRNGKGMLYPYLFVFFLHLYFNSASPYGDKWMHSSEPGQERVYACKYKKMMMSYARFNSVTGWKSNYLCKRFSDRYHRIPAVNSQHRSSFHHFWPIGIRVWLSKLIIPQILLSNSNAALLWQIRDLHDDYTTLLLLWDFYACTWTNYTCR